MKRCFLVLILTTFIFCCSSSSEMDSNSENVMQEMVIEKDTLPAFSGEFMAATHPTEGNAYVNSDKTKLEIIGFKSDGGPLVGALFGNGFGCDPIHYLRRAKGLGGKFCV